MNQKLRTKMICNVCNSISAHDATRTRQVTYMGHDLCIENDVYTNCDNCKTEYYSAEQAKNADRLLVDARRRSEGIITRE